MVATDRSRCVFSMKLLPICFHLVSRLSPRFHFDSAEFALLFVRFQPKLQLARHFSLSESVSSEKAFRWRKPKPKKDKLSTERTYQHFKMSGDSEIEVILAPLRASVKEQVRE